MKYFRNKMEYRKSTSQPNKNHASKVDHYNFLNSNCMIKLWNEESFNILPIIFYCSKFNDKSNE